jgi:solute:Na+ symporter, SSS family
VTVNIVDIITLLAYAGMLIGIASWHSRRIAARDDYFLAGRSMSRWPIAMSMYVALFSTNTFIGVIGWVNRPDGTIWIGLQNIGIILAVPLVIALYPDIFFRLRISTAYEYLEKRFNYPVRAAAALFFMGSRVMWMATMLYGGGLVISQLLGWTAANGMPAGHLYAIVLLGALGTFFALGGGIRAVIWTDVAQFFVLFGSVAVMIVLAAARSGGPAHILSIAADAGKFTPPEFFSLTTDLSIVSGLCLGMISLLSSAGADQMILQTYLTAKSAEEAKKSLWFNGLFLKPLSLIFPLLGIIIFAYFREHPAEAALMRIPDDALPVFVLNVLPGGVRGLAIAALMSALLTSVGSGLAALSASMQIDFIQRRMNRPLSERAAVRLGRTLTFVWGTVIVAAAILVLRLGAKNNIIQILNIVMYPFAGVLLGIFLSGLLTRRANGPGTLIGAIFGFGITVGGPQLAWLRGLSNFYYGALGTMATVTAGYAASLLFDAPPEHKLDGLTHARTSAISASRS